MSYRDIKLFLLMDERGLPMPASAHKEAKDAASRPCESEFGVLEPVCCKPEEHVDKRRRADSLSMSWNDQPKQAAATDRVLLTWLKGRDGVRAPPY